MSSFNNGSIDTINNCEDRQYLTWGKGRKDLTTTYIRPNDKVNLSARETFTDPYNLYCYDTTPYDNIVGRKFFTDNKTRRYPYKNAFRN